jgi:uncharacterized protein YbaP (TraB family)
VFQEITDELAESVDNLNFWQRQIRMHSIEKIRQALGGRKSTLSHIPTGQTFVNLPDRSIEVLETDTVADIKAKLANPFEKKTMSITGLKSGAFQDMLAQMRKEIADAQNQGVADVMAAKDQAAAEIKTTISGVKDKIKSEVADALQEFAEYSNGGPA